MPAMPPSEFVASAKQKGFIFSVKLGGALGVKPPPGGSLTEPMRRYVSAMKAELLALLSPSCEAEASELRQVKVPFVAGEPIGDTPQELRQVATKLAPELAEVGRKSTPRLEHIETVSRGELKQVQTLPPLELVEVGKESPSGKKLYTDKRQEVLCWAFAEAMRGTLPEPSEPLALPSGQRIAPGGASVWLQEAQKRAEGLSDKGKAHTDAYCAFLVVRQDMRALALWAADARVWLDAPYTHDGELCLLPSALAATFEGSLVVPL